ncbi:excinuclease ABC subunit UvrC [Sneathiella sp. P13V-1]|uniref:excinuclease ABC subunit UvrC n=1 Tax=Sneathiella sp. P13V-1 TaxID=2697366 RepID=UPI00187B56DC|nr:excinuclease ABC subunit UvrC [Sneathiella sp. P13V-1]MBE7638055.1 excinuclease ABC subunit UvrC [Sneathiella sp. P13V-1]
MTESTQEKQESPFQRGAGVITKFLKTLPPAPGVYRMIDENEQILYVGKAKNLRNRVSSYTKPTGQSTRIMRMVSLTHAMEFVRTHTEVEALLLEANLIKKLKPRYNIILRDDKSFPYILITSDHKWPQITKHRGKRNKKGEYFGPFASAGAVNETLATFQRLFPLRSCSDSDFETRTRPCLQYQIKRCSAPCVDRITEDDYQAVVQEARDFLSGKSHVIQQALADKMHKASDELDFEQAAIYRDRLKAMAHIQSKQTINLTDTVEVDVIAAHQEGGQTCVQVFFIRSGQNLGNRAHYPSHNKDMSPDEVLSAFIGQFYDSRPAPKQIWVSHIPEESDLLSEALSISAGHKVQLMKPQRGDKKEMLDHAIMNAKGALQRKMAENASQLRQLKAVGELFEMEKMPERIEVYDNSHISGTHQVGAMIVATKEGFEKKGYRKFNIKDKDLAPGDDYGMMREVLTRRFSRLKKEDPNKIGEGSGSRELWPDLVLIDGGAGQLSAAVETFQKLEIDDVTLVGIAKGPDRNAGRERFFLPGKPAFSMPEKDPTLYFLQRLRDEVHHFAITSHRARRSQAIGKSPLDDIEGIGGKRKKALLNRFGSAKGVAGAALADLEQVEGISERLARVIFDHFHEER